MSTAESRRKHAEYMHQWIEDNKEKVREQKRHDYLKHRESRIQHMREYYKQRSVDPEYNREYYRRNREAIISRVREWNKNNKEKKVARRIIYKEQNAEAIKERNRRYYYANKREITEKNKQYYERTRAHRVAAAKRYAKNNPDKITLWRLNTKANRRRKIKKAAIPFTADQLQQRLSMYGHRCWMCKGKFEEIDHVIPLDRGGLHALANLRPACRPCNRKKHARDHRLFIQGLK